MKRMLILGLVMATTLVALAETSEGALFRRRARFRNNCSSCNSCNMGQQHQAGYAPDGQFDPSAPTMQGDQLSSPPPVPGQDSIDAQGGAQANINQNQSGVSAGAKATTPRRSRKAQANVEVQNP